VRHARPGSKPWWFQETRWIVFCTYGGFTLGIFIGYIISNI
jgi:hypothetical protein